MLTRLVRPVAGKFHRALSFRHRYSAITSFPSIRNFTTTPQKYQTPKKDDKNKKDEKSEEKKSKFSDRFEEQFAQLPLVGKIALGLGLIIGLPYMYENGKLSSVPEINVNDFCELVRTNKIKSMSYIAKKRTLIVTDKNGREQRLEGLDYDMLRNRVEQVYDSISLHPANRMAIKKDSDFRPTDFSDMLLDIIFSPTMLLVLVLVMMNRSMMNQMRGQFGGAAKKPVPGKPGKKGEKKQGSFFDQLQPGGGAMSRQIGELVDPKDIKVSFADVAGCEEAKIETIEIVDFLKNSKKYTDMGAKVPKGAILHGPPGTGKTLLAKACAAEAGVNFIHCSGSDFIEMFVGLGAKRIRELFETARENSPCILFIDEIDAVGKKRSGGKGMGGNQEADQTINALLVEMDGFNTQEPVVIMGATNQVESLDQALTRPGRFDRQIFVGLPDVKGRNSIFRVHLNRIKTELDRNDLSKKLAVRTPGMSGADIDNVVNEAALNAVRYADTSVGMTNFNRAIDRVIAGMEKKSDIMDPETKKRVALHEAGHAVTSWFLEYCSPLVKVTIVPRTQGALGFAMYQPKENVLQTQKHFQDQIAMALGGRAAEDIFYDGVVSSGAHDDLKKTTSIAYMMIARLGMSDKLKNINIEDTYQQISGGGMRNSYPSEETKLVIDNEITAMIDTEYKRTIALLEDKKGLVKALADKLLEKETIERQDVVEVLGPRPWKDESTYEEQVANTRESEEDLSLPPGLKHWEKSFKNSIKYKKADDLVKEKEQKQLKEEVLANTVPLPAGWDKKHDPVAGSYYLHQANKISTLRHPGLELPSGWKAVRDAQGRERYVHTQTGTESWLLEEDTSLPVDVKAELDKK